MESEAPDPPLPASAQELGAELARLRHERGMTGQALAAAVGISQSSVSKIENGLLRVSPADAERIAEALQAPPDEVRHLVELAVRGRSEPVRRPSRRRVGAGGEEAARLLGVSLDQQEVLDAERQATLIREFEPILLPGLIQISEYARRVVNGYHRITIGGDEGTWYQRTAEKVSQRIRRQNLLYESGRRFEFILMESVLGNRFAPPEYMIGQIGRIAAVAELPNVMVRIVPSSAQLEYPHVQGFTILDESLVVVETLEATGYDHPDQIRIYGKIFDEYAALSASDPQAILATYMSTYAGLLTPRRTDPTGPRSVAPAETRGASEVPRESPDVSPTAGTDVPE
ncbi:helix-turn-helix transcriptional regulator [Frankia sp. AgB32]|uniref:helix-turn-helix domain-containing protein n=1 Tax=Frankia sp. AgB32 TaxID=631119 RepID=UPI00200D32C4|nr:helix-turn-helix transcriptional regulator [Frankia sp. AgB32]MCK9895134.1 helix-turn-helix domain-containing protein [Frankia sp. AgB32]